VYDPTGAAADPELPSLAAALDPSTAEAELARLPRLAPGGELRLEAIRVVRHKLRRRCLVEYDVMLEPESSTAPPSSVLGKVQRRRYGKAGFRQLEALRLAGFDESSADGIAVPEPLGTIGRFRMWVQRKVRDAASATELVEGAGGEAIGRRIAEAAHKLHRAGVPPERWHEMADELRILERCLTVVAEERPTLGLRLERLAERCRALAARTPEGGPAGIHRDLYTDQVLVANGHLYLVDFDLYCLGDPALDIGNVLGHLTEQALRRLGDPAALAHVEAALEERFAELAGERARRGARAYATLTLARHVYLSRRLPERGHLTERLLELCEVRLAPGVVAI